MTKGGSNDASSTKVEEEFNEFQSFSSTGSIRQTSAPSDVWMNSTPALPQHPQVVPIYRLGSRYPCNQTKERMVLLIFPEVMYMDL